MVITRLDLHIYEVKVANKFESVSAGNEWVRH